MENIENYVEIEVHNKIMQSLRQKQLQYKTKIIELQKQNQYEANRANQFQQKFKQALLHTGAGNEKSLLDKLSQKQNENNDLRKEILKLKKNVDVLRQQVSVSSLIKSNTKNSNQSMQEIKHLQSQNQEMAKTIQQLKTAAISAIMSKDDQIQELNQKISKAQQLAILYQNLTQREQFLQKEIQKLRKQAQQEQKILTQKLTKQREKYIQKLQQFQRNLQLQESSKEELLQKAQTLQSSLESKQQIIELYEHKINELQTSFKQQRKALAQERQMLIIQADNLKDRSLFMQKELGTFQKIVSQLKFKQKEFKVINDRLRDQKAELQRKLTIKKRKNNPNLKSSDIYSSFEGISQKSSFYSSFYKPQQSKPSDLGQIQQLEETDILQNFIDLQQRQDLIPEEVKPLPKPTKKKQKALEVQISPQEAVQQPKFQQRISQQEVKDSQVIQQTIQPNIVQQIKHTPAPLIVTSEMILSSSQYLDLRNLYQSSQTQLKCLMQNNQSLKQQHQNSKSKIQQLYSQIQKLNTQISTINSQVRLQRQSLIQLRSQTQKSQKQKQLIYELQNLKQHVFKLQNALLIEKLQNAEKQQFMKERNERQRRGHQQKINKLNEEVKNLSPKKKKGFFGR